MKIASLGIAMALGATPLVAHAQVSVSGGISFNVGAVPGEGIGSVDVFYDQLSPYGVWVNDPVVGQAFIPDATNYVPYTNGHWAMTDVGFVWVSTEPFAWATSHYGRWFYSDDYGRWMWIPDTTWGPNWVDWYEADGNFGWAPLAPQVVIDAGYSTPYWAYRFAPSDRILSADVSRYYVPRDRVETYRRDARPITYREQGRDHQVIVGPSPQALQQHRITARPQKVDVKTVGRMNAGDLRAAEQRAETRKPQIERQNAQRLDQHAEIKKTVETRATKAPTNRERTDLNRAQPETKTQPETKAQPQNRTQPETKAQPQNKAEPQNRTPPARPEPKGVTPGANDRGDNNRARPDRANDHGDLNRETPTHVNENARPEPKATPQPEPKAAPTPRPEPKATPQPEPKAAPTPRPEPKATPQPEPRETTRPSPTPPTREERTPPQPEPKAAPTPRPQPSEMPRPEPTPRPEPKAAPAPRPEPQAAPTPRPEPQATHPEPKATPQPKGQAQGHNDKHQDQH